MAIRTSSSTTVRLNAKIESVNFMRLPYLATAFEGCILALDQSGKCVLGSQAMDDVAQVAYLNFTPTGLTPGRSDVVTVQKDPFRDDGSSITIETGGLTGIMGTGFEVGLPATSTHWTSIPTAATSMDKNKFVCLAGTDAASNGKLAIETIDEAWTSPTAAVAFRLSVGRVTRIENGIVYFTFNSQLTSIPTAV